MADVVFHKPVAAGIGLRVYKCDPVTKMPADIETVHNIIGFQILHEELIVWCLDAVQWEGCFRMPISELSHTQFIYPEDTDGRSI